VAARAAGLAGLVELLDRPPGQVQRGSLQFGWLLCSAAAAAGLVTAASRYVETAWAELADPVRRSSLCASNRTEASKIHGRV